MTPFGSPSNHPVIAEEIQLTLVELCQVCQVSVQEVRVFVVEGVLEPVGHGPEDWRFPGSSIRRARTAHRLSRDLEVNLAGIAVALNLLDEIAKLNERLELLGRFHGPTAEDPPD